MSSFTTPLVVSPMPDGRTWKLVKSFKYHIGSKYSKDVISVTAGFVTDFASIPWFFWTFLPYWGKYGKAAVVHDWLYRTQQFTKETTDLLFYDAMRVGGTSRWKAMIMYLAVRYFGRYKK